MTPDNIIAGFEKCGLLPLNSQRPDYSKLESAAAQKENPATIFEGINQGKFWNIHSYSYVFHNLLVGLPI